MKPNHIKAPSWLKIGDKRFKRERSPFDAAALELPPDTVNGLSLSVLLSPQITLSIFCDGCHRPVDFSDYCADCGAPGDRALFEMFKEGQPYPEPPDEYCRCGWLRNYCLCHLNLALFSNKKHKPGQ